MVNIDCRFSEQLKFSHFFLSFYWNINIREHWIGLIQLCCAPRNINVLMTHVVRMVTYRMIDHQLTIANCNNSTKPCPAYHLLRVIQSFVRLFAFVAILAAFLLWQSVRIRISSFVLVWHGWRCSVTWKAEPQQQTNRTHTKIGKNIQKLCVLICFGAVLLDKGDMAYNVWLLQKRLPDSLYVFSILLLCSIVRTTFFSLWSCIRRFFVSFRLPGHSATSIPHCNNR